MVKALFFLVHFWPRLSTMKVLVGLGHFWPRIPLVKLLLGLGHFWPRLLPMKKFLFFMGIFGQGYYHWPLRLWIPMMKVMFVIWDFEQPLVSRSAKREFAFAGGNVWNPTVQAVRAPGGICWHGIASTSISYPGMERVKNAWSYFANHSKGSEWLTCGCRIIFVIDFLFKSSCSNTGVFLFSIQCTGISCLVSVCNAAVVYADQWSEMDVRFV